MDRVLLIFSTFCFCLGFVYSLLTFRLKVPKSITSKWNLAIVGTGFLLQTGFLWLRGEALGRCPLTNVFETLVFMSWATVLFYLLIGNTYRLSPLGAFTAPVAFLLQVVALLFLNDSNAQAPTLPHSPTQPWLEFHAAFSVLAYGAFALAGISGGLYLWQERQLKTHHLRPSFFQLPPIQDLYSVTGRLMTTGFALLTLGLAAGCFALGVPKTGLHLGCALFTWITYGGAVAAWQMSVLTPRRVAAWSIAGFCIALVTFGGL